MLGRAGSWVGNASSGASVTNGTLATMQATTGTTGQLFYNTTYNAYFNWVVDRWIPFGIPDPRYGFVMAWEEFTGSDRIGTLDWSGGNQLAGNLLNPGMYSVTQSAASGLTRTSGQLNTFQLGTMDLYMETTMAIPTFSNGVDNACFSWFLNDGSAFDTAGACTDGCYIAFNSSVITTNTTSNGTNTAKTAAATLVAGTFYRFGLYVNAGTSANFTINGSSLTPAHSTNLPTGAGRQTGINFRVDKQVGSGAMSISIDNFLCYGFFNGQRVS